MSILPEDLERLPPQAHDVIRFLAAQPDGAGADAIIAGAGISERAFGKAIRRLVTRYYVSMPSQGFYCLTAAGIDAAALLGPAEPPADRSVAIPARTASERPEPATPVPEPPAPAADPLPPRQVRRLSAFLPRELVQYMPTQVRIGLDPAAPDAPTLGSPLRVVLRLNAEACEVLPAESALEVGAGAAGPAVFRVTPNRTGPLRLTITVLQPLTPAALIPTGSMFFEVRAAGHPTPASATFATFSADVRLVLVE